MNYDFDRNAATRHCVPHACLDGLNSTDRVAELMAWGLQPKAIAEICRHANGVVANAQIQRIRKNMGWQAQ